MNERRRRLAFVAIVVLQILVLAAMIARRVHLLQTGQRVRIQCEPIDPRSILSGDYVVLDFAISRFSRPEVQRLVGVEGELRFRRHERVYVALEPVQDAPIRQAAAISRDLKRLRQRYQVVLRGTVRDDFDIRWSPRLRVRYGVEQYFVPQHEGRRIERQMRQTSVEVAVAPSGESAVRRLFIGGQELTFR